LRPHALAARSAQHARAQPPHLNPRSRYPMPSSLTPFPYLPRLFLPLGFLAGLVGFPVVSTAETDPSILLDQVPLLLADDSGLTRSAGVVRTIHVAQTDPAPVIVPDRPWEGSCVCIYGSVYYDPASEQF